jgi:hypothetical protein
VVDGQGGEPLPGVAVRGQFRGGHALVRFAAEQRLCEPSVNPPKGLTLMLGMVVWDVRFRASTRER